MINYKLAKELKEAGFPWDWSHMNVGNELYQKSFCKTPTLSELIEACGDGFDILVDLGQSDWVAGVWDGCGGGDVVVPYIWNKADSYGEGKTKEIAVAKLWLEINKPVDNSQDINK